MSRPLGRAPRVAPALRRVTVAVVLAWISPLTAWAVQRTGVGVVEGTVTSRDGEPVPGAVLEIVDTKATTRTDELGRFAFTDVRPGLLVLTVRRLGYGPLEVEIELRGNEHLVIEPGVIVMDPVPVDLAGVTVKGEAWEASLSRSGFYERRLGEAGLFVEREELEQWNPRVFTDVLRRLPGVRVRPNPMYGQRPNPFSVRDTRRYIVELVRSPLVGCDPLLFLDGMYLGTLGTVDVDTQVNEGDLAGVEVYRGTAEVPSRFRMRGASCGVIVLWTR